MPKVNGEAVLPDKLAIIAFDSIKDEKERIARLAALARKEKLCYPQYASSYSEKRERDAFKRFIRRNVKHGRYLKYTKEVAEEVERQNNIAQKRERTRFIAPFQCAAVRQRLDYRAKMFKRFFGYCFGYNDHNIMLVRIINGKPLAIVNTSDYSRRQRYRIIVARSRAEMFIRHIRFGKRNRKKKVTAEMILEMALDDIDYILEEPWGFGRLV